MGIGAAVGGAVDAAATLGAAGMEINEENKARHLAENYAGQGQADVRAGAAAYNQLLSPYLVLAPIHKIVQKLKKLLKQR